MLINALYRRKRCEAIYGYRKMCFLYHIEGIFFLGFQYFFFLSFEVELLIFCLLALFKLSKFILYTRIFHQ